MAITTESLIFNSPYISYRFGLVSAEGNCLEKSPVCHHFFRLLYSGNILTLTNENLSGIVSILCLAFIVYLAMG